MKLGYITKEDPNDIRAYSGTHFSMFQALKREFEQVVPIGPIDHWYKNIAKLKGKVRIFGTDKVYKYQYDIELAKKHAKILDQRIKQENPDVLLGSLVSPEVAFLKSNIPLYLTTDATFPRLNELHKSHRNLHSKSYENAMVLEEMAFRKSKGLILPLEWLKKSAIEDYDIAPDNISIISYGPNIETNFSKETISDLIQQRVSNQKIEFLFVGINWEQKGGPEALAIIKELNNRGIDAVLNVVGCAPSLRHKKMKVYGFLDKQDPEELAQLTELYKKVSFFLLPTKAECVGMSFIEAASFGLPAIGTNVGGVPEAVVNNKTGLLFNSDEAPTVIAQAIFETWKDKSLYENMCKAAFEKYHHEMNWKNWASKFRQTVDQD
jgi:glycosyltransferase involved in cell wall biosynthesis